MEKSAQRESDNRLRDNIDRAFFAAIRDMINANDSLDIAENNTALSVGYTGVVALIEAHAGVKRMIDSSFAERDAAERNNGNMMREFYDIATS